MRRMNWNFLVVLILVATATAGCVSAASQVRLAELVDEQKELLLEQAELAARLLSAIQNEGEDGPSVGEIRSQLEAFAEREQAVIEEIIDIKSNEKATWGGVVGGAVVGILRGLPSKGPLVPIVQLLMNLFGKRKDD